MPFNLWPFLSCFSCAYWSFVSILILWAQPARRPTSVWGSKTLVQKHTHDGSSVFRAILTGDGGGEPWLPAYKGSKECTHHFDLLPGQGKEGRAAQSCMPEQRSMGTVSGHTNKQTHELNKDSVQSSQVSEGNYYLLKYHIWFTQTQNTVEEGNYRDKIS